MLEFMWDLVQQRQIGEARGDAVVAKQVAQSTEQRLRDLEQSFDRLMLINRALWETIRRFHPVDDQYLAAKVQEIDLRDGRADGKLSRKSVVTCRRCGQVLSKRHSSCIYCGTPDLQTDSFDKVK